MMSGEEAAVEAGSAEEIRKRRLSEYRKKAAEQQKLKEQLKTALRQVLENDAYERLNNVSFSNEQLYMAAAKQIIMLANRAGRKLTDREVLYVLNAIRQQTKKESEITFIKK